MTPNLTEGRRLLAAAEDRRELMRAFGAISLAVAAIDGGSDNTPWRDVVARIETIGRQLDLSRKLHEQSARERIAAEEALADAAEERDRLRGALEGLVQRHMRDGSPCFCVCRWSSDDPTANHAASCHDARAALALRKGERDGE